MLAPHTDERHTVKRTLAVIALTASLATGFGASAQAASTPERPDRIGSAVRYAPKPGPVKVCIAALKWAHKVPDGDARYDREDRAIVICSKVIRTERQAQAVYRWAEREEARTGDGYVLDMLG